jgi:hypothetical protein
LASLSEPPQKRPSGSISGCRRFRRAADVEAFALFFFGDAQADHQVDDLVGDEGDHAGPDHGGQHALELDPDLAPIE